MKKQAVIPKKLNRNYLPSDFKVDGWEGLKPYFDELENRSLDSIILLKKWFKDLNELGAVISEDAGWRYINMTRYTDNKKFSNAYKEFVQEIQPQISPFSNRLNLKGLESNFIKELEKEQGYDIMIRGIRNEAQIFREKNIKLSVEVQSLTQKYNVICGGMTVKIDDKEYTLQQAGVKLMSPQRDIRERTYAIIAKKRVENADQLNRIFDELISIRHQIAKNADFENYRDYKFKAMGRFDYTPNDCHDFHLSVKEIVVPMLDELAKNRKKSLKLDSLKPWDKSVDLYQREPLKPFSDSDDLISKTISCFYKIDNYLGDCLSTMNKMGHLDLESRKGKSPGGYNYPLSETGVPFIFMNATSTLRDMITILHEGGHAVHSFLTNDLELTDFKQTPSEVAELASMSMELISMDYWDVFFDDEQYLKRAKKEHLEQIIETLPWVALIDKFQHWIYTHPSHTLEERLEIWTVYFDDYSDSITDWTGLEKIKNYIWQKQLHLYEVPFYYIEYGVAQLGAIAIWKNYKENKKLGLEGYINALKLGYTKSIPKIYETANIKFDFSKKYIQELINFIKEELSSIDD